jgi:ParB-like nuclease domain
MNEAMLNLNVAECPVMRKRVASLKPSPENHAIYRARDPDIVSLAESIKKRGLLEPLCVTLDNYIVSGHRRFAALQHNGQKHVSCRVLPLRRDALSTDDYIVFLREFNRQRNKSVAEQVREELIDIDRAGAYKRLQKKRDVSVNADRYNEVAELDIEGYKVRHDISDQKAQHVKYFKQVVFTDRRAYWPLSVRSVHYAMLNYTFFRNIPRRLLYRNDDDSYQKTSELGTRLRLKRTIPWAALDDETRPLKLYRAFSDVREYIRQEIGNLFTGYWRNLLQSQPNHIEVVCEKNTIFHMVQRVTKKYQIPTSSARGFSSIDLWHDLAERFIASNKERLILIVLSDYDPEGEMIVQAAGRTLHELGVEECDLTVIKAAVTRVQIEKYDLPEQNFAKESSSNYDWFVARNKGDDSVYELEAMQPEIMLRELDAIICSVIDLDLFEREVQAETEEAAYLEAMQKTVAELLKGIGE